VEGQVATAFAATPADLLAQGAFEETGSREAQYAENAGAYHYP